MLRVLVLIAAIIFFRNFFLRRRRRAVSAMSPYMNSLDGMVSAQQLSSLLDEFDHLNSRAPRGRAAS